MICLINAGVLTQIALLFCCWQEMQLPCAEVVDDSGVLDLLVRLLDSTQRCLSATAALKPVPTPKWVTPLLLLLDLYEKVAVVSKRKADLKQVVVSSGMSRYNDTFYACL